MAKIDITKTELVWPGKYNEDGSRREVAHVCLPFQVIETVNESRATREEKKKPANQDLFDYMSGKEGDTFEDGWKNKLIWGDNLLVMGSLLEQFAGKIDLIYIDPPFATGADFSISALVGESGEEVSREQTIIEEKAYRDTWGRGMDSYITMMFDRLVLMRELLAESGSIYVHMGIQVNHYVRLILENIFGQSNLVSELIWSYGSPSGGRAGGTKAVKVHEYILHFSKNYPKRTENKIYLPYSQKYIEERFIYTDEEGRRYRTRKRANGIVQQQYLDESPGVPLSTVWSDIKQTYAMHLSHRAAEEVGYPTQKPETLLERTLLASSNEGGLVADFFCGSGTTATVAEKLGRRWITCDLGRWAVHTTRKRMLGIENCKPFDVLNLGKYERQYWQGATFGDSKDITEQTLYEYLAFILKLYGAQPLAGMAHLHGKKGKALVHIGAVDAPVTINQVNQAVGECVQIKQQSLHVLGWEWEMGLNDLVIGAAKSKGVKLSLFNIPREVMEQQATDKGDVRFFELAYLEADIKQLKKLAVQVQLKDFVMADAENLPDEAREKVTKWSDYIDYWAVDWDFQGDTFMQGWVAYRTRKERALPLTSDEHTYAEAGTYQALIKVIDIFGNDTSQMLTIKVK